MPARPVHRDLEKCQTYGVPGTFDMGRDSGWRNRSEPFTKEAIRVLRGAGRQVEGNLQIRISGAKVLIANGRPQGQPDLGKGPSKARQPGASQPVANAYELVTTRGACPGSPNRLAVALSIPCKARATAGR